MKQRWPILLIALLIASSSFGQYRKMQVFELAAGADLIVKGKISLIKGGYFTLDIKEVLAGDYKGSEVKIKRFKNYKGVKRWAKYQEDEDLFLFLRKGGTSFEIMGLGGEGEKLIMANEVFLDSRGEGVKNRFGYQPMLLQGNIYAEKLDLPDFEDAVRGFRACFSVSYKEVITKDGEAWKEPLTQKICEDKELDTYRAKSWIHDTMAQHAEKVLE
ncbi:MAG TPA: hypothetical protein ENJ82_12060 [Bacteroidetes bacterium]|nr:hypothetical protein [Bacteroidota bacterium]